MEFDFLLEGTYYDFVPLLSILLAGWIGYLAIARRAPLAPVVIHEEIPDVRKDTTKINIHMVDIPPFHSLRVFLMQMRIKASPETPFPIRYPLLSSHI